ncbi:hypothetical protein [Brevundimonas variabilis]|uniref:Uncharacterized protein n=1 Tax=Brevundimonas variabilis TaxID=74312 RepID=A0A7W9CJ14_9CAUL|nr:hypothetical protein [Brevundimonas variabilis]MBB5746573.1 hypothetical protein [Brevundimonas variabilis]
MANLNYRDRARKHVAEARARLAESGEAAARQACLALRMAIEALTYQNLQAYLAETPNSVMTQWTPKKVMDELLAADPHADQTVTVFFGIEETPGVPSKDMQLLGEDRRFTQAWGNKAHNALGSFLHEPTIRQTETGKPTEQQARTKAVEIADELDRILATSLFGVNMGEYISFDCDCGFHVKRRASVLSHDDKVICGGCGRHWIYKKLEGDPAYGFILDGCSFDCLSCQEICQVPAHEIGDGKIVTCAACGAKAEVFTQFAVRPAPAETGDAGAEGGASPTS